MVEEQRSHGKSFDGGYTPRLTDKHLIRSDSLRNMHFVKALTKALMYAVGENTQPKGVSRGKVFSGRLPPTWENTQSTNVIRHPRGRSRGIINKRRMDKDTGITETIIGGEIS